MRASVIIGLSALLVGVGCGRGATESITLGPADGAAPTDGTIIAPDVPATLDVGPVAGDADLPPDDSGPILVDADINTPDGDLPDGGPPPSPDADLPPPDGSVSRDATAPGDGAVPPDAGGCTQDRDCGRGGGFNVFCEPMSGQCLECFQPQHCRGGQICDFTGGNVCRTACFAGGRCPPNQVCDTANNFCVGCVTSMDCGAGEVCTAARECVECANNADCAGHFGRPACDVATNTCVGCLSDADCGAGTCDTQLQACVSSPGARGLCEPCSSDTECGAAGDLCIGLNVGGGNFLDRACALDCSNSSCPAGFDCIDVRGGSAQQCRPSYAMNNPTCTAISHLGDPCPFSATDSDPGCGLQGRQDALCILAPGGTSGVCTIGCADAADCPTGFTCTGASPNGSGVCL